MKREIFTVILSLCATLLTSGAANAGTVMVTGKSPLPPTHFNGFENIGTDQLYGSSYTEDGITVSYVGSFSSIWASTGIGEGQHSWYPNGGGYGYTSVTFDPVSAIQFFVGSGWYSGSPTLAYEVLYQGSLVTSGEVAGISVYPNQGSYFGFSGGMFDELHLQVQNASGAFNPTSYEAGVFDSFATGVAGASGVPEPQSWALMIGGFGLAGATLRRRRYNLKVLLA